MTEQDFAREVVRKLTQHGHQALWAGGCVRDLLLGIPASDYDVATSARPDQIRELFGRAHTLPVGAAFGVMVVLSKDRKLQVEVATFRTDAKYSDGRHPDSVEFSTPEMDAQRRDFTINGLFYDPLSEQVIDYVRGQEDLASSTLRAIGDPDARISEDKLRMLRAIRFAARYNLKIDASTYLAVKRHSAEIHVVSGERLAIELQKTLSTDRAAWALIQWAETGLLKMLLPDLENKWQLCGQAAIELLKPASESWLARLAGLFWVIDPTEWRLGLEALKARLKFSNEQIAALSFALQSQVVLQHSHQHAWSKVQPFLISPWFNIALELLRLRMEAGQVARIVLSWLEERMTWPGKKLNPPPLVDGKDLLDLGLKASPKFKSILQQIRDQQLDDRLKTREQALQWVVVNYKN